MTELIGNPLPILPCLKRPGRPGMARLMKRYLPHAKSLRTVAPIRTAKKSMPRVMAENARQILSSVLVSFILHFFSLIDVWSSNAIRPSR